MSAQCVGYITLNSPAQCSVPQSIVHQYEDGTGFKLQSLIFSLFSRLDKPDYVKFSRISKVLCALTESLAGTLLTSPWGASVLQTSDSSF